MKAEVTEEGRLRKAETIPRFCNLHGPLVVGDNALLEWHVVVHAVMEDEIGKKLTELSRMLGMNRR